MGRFRSSELLAAAAIWSNVSQAFPSSLEPTAAQFIRMPIKAANLSKLFERQNFYVPLGNTLATYQVEVSLGSPAQPISLRIDTGSSDIWVYSPGSCSACVGGVYDPSLSSSSVYQPSLGSLDITYFDHTAEHGYYVTDDLEMSGTTVTSAIFAVATSTSDRYSGILGIGLDGLEESGSPYHNIIDEMQSQGLIRTRAYSLYLDDLEASSGAVIFGGYDTSKYVGDLVTLPIVQSSDGRPRLNVDWTSLTISTAAGTVDYTPSYLPYPACMDSGYSGTVLGNDVYDRFAAYFGVVRNSNGAYKVSCDLGSGSVDFGFGSNPQVIISVPFSEIAVPNFIDNTGGCVFGFEAAETNKVISFGDTFLRSAYVLYNYDSYTISLAQSSYDQGCTNCAVTI